MIKTVQNSSPTVSAQENCPLNRKLPQPTGSWSIVYQATLLQRTQIVSSHHVITKIGSSHRHKPALKSSLSNQVPLLWDNIVKSLITLYQDQNCVSVNLMPNSASHCLPSNRKLPQPTGSKKKFQEITYVSLTSVKWCQSSCKSSPYVLGFKKISITLSSCCIPVK